MAKTHFSGPVESKAGYNVNGNPLIDVANYVGSDKRIRCGSVSVADGGTINTGLSAIDSFQLTTTVAGHIVTGTASGGTITVKILNHDGAAVTVAETVHWLAVGS